MGREPKAEGSIIISHWLCVRFVFFCIIVFLRRRRCGKHRNYDRYGEGGRVRCYISLLEERIFPRDQLGMGEK